MTPQEVQAIVAKVIAAYIPAAQQSFGEIMTEMSARHVHLTHQAVETLFGPGAQLTKRRDLSQGGEFLSEQRVRLVTAKGEFANVAVLGPERPAVQVELSRSDCRALGINAPVNLSGNLDGAADVYIIGPQGILDARGSAIVAKSHIHLPPAEAQRRGLSNGQIVSVRMRSGRPLTFEGVEVRVRDTFTPAFHIDLDEANACGLDDQTTAVILSSPGGAGSCPPAGTPPCAAPAPLQLEVPKLVTESVARRLTGKVSGELVVDKGVIVTPAALDVLRGAKIALRRK